MKRGRHRALDEWAKLMFAAPSLPYAQRTRKVQALFQGSHPRTAPAGQAATLFLIALPNVDHYVDATTRDGVYVRAAQCLAAVKRWRLLHQGKLSGLAEMCRAAGLSRVPIDDFSGSPLKLVMIAGEPVMATTWRKVSPRSRPVDRPATAWPSSAMPRSAP